MHMRWAIGIYRRRRLWYRVALIVPQFFLFHFPLGHVIFISPRQFSFMLTATPVCNSADMAPVGHWYFWIHRSPRRFSTPERGIPRSRVSVSPHIYHFSLIRLPGKFSVLDLIRCLFVPQACPPTQSVSCSRALRYL